MSHSEMSKDIKIKSLEIVIGQKTLTLTLEEAKQLKDRLDELFPEKVMVLPSWPTYIPFNPVTLITPKFDKWEVTCKNNILSCALDN